MKKYPEHKNLNLPSIGKEILAFWDEQGIFEKSVSSREGKEAFVFYEGPPSANGLPGIHHVMARAIKDIFCRYQTLKGKKVERKAGWDTHGLPIELAVEKTLGITKEDIGTKITVEEYNQACRKEVMKYTDKWEELTRIMGYWVDMKNPYVTYENKYIETVWWLLHELYEKKLLYKGYSIQPYSPAAGTGLSSHELNQPGCYRNVKDTSVVAQFRIREDERFNDIFVNFGQERSMIPVENFYFLAWTTTPWTLPSNCALAVGENIYYDFVAHINPYSKEVCVGVVAHDLFNYFFAPAYSPDLPIEEAEKLVSQFKNDPFGLLNALKEVGTKQFKGKTWGHTIATLKGKDLLGIKYEQLLPYVKPNGKALEVIPGDFVTTEDGTGIVHTASVFGADDYRVCKENGIVSILVKDENGNDTPLVDKRGRFVKEVNDPDWGFANEYVKQEYLSKEEKEEELGKQQEKLKKFIPNLKEYLSVDERIALKLKLEGKAFKIEKYEHNYPHCWRTDKPILYYPLDSWFIKVTEPKIKEKMIALNKTIYWKPESTGTGRFGEWLNNLQDWNLSRSRFWGIPLPIWRTESGGEEKCIASAEELAKEIGLSVKAGFMKNNPLSKFANGDNSEANYKTFDLHKPYVDDIILVSSEGERMKRESDLIDVWFDSGSMPYAQQHYPFENREAIDNKKAFPADFIAEGVDQTRGWFYTLHAIATMCFDSVAYKAVISNGLVLDKNGNKMSKRLGNTVDPFQTIDKYGPDAVRWYMISNASPWDNLKFDIEGVTGVQRSFFGTLYNTYAFFALYANIDSYSFDDKNVVPEKDRSELDRWILSKLNNLVRNVSKNLEDYDPTPAARAIEEFVDQHLSNWYVRLSRRRFWKGEISADKRAAYDTLYECLKVTSQLMSPFAPFFGEWLFRNLNAGESVHLSYLPASKTGSINQDLEEKMDFAQKISSMVFSIRKKENIRVRQPLTRIQVPVLNHLMKERILAVKNLILSEVNVKELEFVDESSGTIIKNLKLNFKTLGKKCGKDMKTVQAFTQDHAQEIIKGIEQKGEFKLNIGGNEYTLLPEDVEIMPVDIPGWKVANQGAVTVALDVTLTDSLRQEGLARELVNRIQNLRKDKAFEVTDKIELKVKSNAGLDAAIKNNLQYICAETLASSLELVEELNTEEAVTVEVDDQINTLIQISKLN